MARTVGRMISILFRQSRVYLNSVLKPYDITSAEYPFLLFLYNKDGATQDEMSRFLIIDKAATARAIRTLEEKQYVSREKDETDKRCKRVYLSDKSKSLEAEIKSHIYYWTQSLTEDMDQETEDCLYQLLEQMVRKSESLVNTSRQGDCGK